MFFSSFSGGALYLIFKRGQTRGDKILLYIIYVITCVCVCVCVFSFGGFCVIYPPVSWHFPVQVRRCRNTPASLELADSLAPTPSPFTLPIRETLMDTHSLVSNPRKTCQYNENFRDRHQQI